MKNINNLTQWKNGSVDVTFAREIMHQKHFAQSGCSLGAVCGVQWTFSIHSATAYLLKTQSDSKKLSWSVWIKINSNHIYFYTKYKTVALRPFLFTILIVPHFQWGWMLSRTSLQREYSNYDNGLLQTISKAVQFCPFDNRSIFSKFA